MGKFTVYQLFLSATSIADLFSSLHSCIAPKRGVIDVREALGDQEHHDQGKGKLGDQLGGIWHHEERGGEGQDRWPHLCPGFYQVFKH
jgi:hypothetical protein